MKKSISLFGDIVIDLISNKEQYIFKPVIGGSIFNTANTLSKLGVYINFYSFIGNDFWGNYILNELNKLSFNLKTLNILNNYKTSLAFAEIDSSGNAKYDFYKSTTKHKIKLFDFDKSFLFHFGSIFSITDNNQNNIKNFIYNARKNKIIISYDPNFRLIKDINLNIIKKRIINNIKNSNILKCSIEDIKNIFNIENIDEIFNLLQKFDLEIIIITLGENGVCGKLKNNKEIIKVDSIKTDIVDTIGAGDNFSAGFIYFLYKNNFTSFEKIRNLSIDQFYNMLHFSNQIASLCLKNRGANINKEDLISRISTF